MIKAPGYAQYCPLAQAAEILCKRWTMLILRELSFGYSSFNDISRGVPRMSRSLLSSRLKDLAHSGVIEKTKSPNNPHAQYILTPSGSALTEIVRSVAGWGQEWLEIEYALETLDSDHLMWNIRYSAKQHPKLPSPFIVHFFLNDRAENRQNHWLIFDDDEVGLCIIDQNFDVDVQIDVAATTLAKIYMGWSDLEDEIQTNRFKVFGDEKYIKILPEWLGRSGLAHIQKKPTAQQVRLF